MPHIAIDCFADMERAVHQLKIERDTWQAVGLQYKAAFEAQTRRLHEFQDICFSTQAELENERAQQRRLLAISNHSENHGLGTVDSNQDVHHQPLFGTAVVFSSRGSDMDCRQQPSKDCTNPLFKRVQQSVAQHNYGTALVEVERLLRGPLSSKARAEGLLLKSNVLRASGPDELYEALAACSEALELCDRLSELEAFLPRLQYQRGVLYYELRMLHQAREVSGIIDDDDLLPAKVGENGRTCHDKTDQLRVIKRRSGFDENRTLTAELLAQLEEKGAETKRRRTSAQLRQYAAAKAKRMSLPHRWVNSKSDFH